MAAQRAGVLKWRAGESKTVPQGIGMTPGSSRMRPNNAKMRLQSPNACSEGPWQLNLLLQVLLKVNLNALGSLWG